MENTNIPLEKDDQKEEVTVQCATEKIDPTNESLLSKNSIRTIQPDHTFLLNVRRSQTTGNCSEKLFLQNVCGLHNKIPMHIISFDEKYVLRCVQVIHNYALRAAAWNFASQMDILSDSWSSSAVINNRSSYKMARLATEFPLAAVMESVVISSNNDWIISTVTGSNSMMNILKSPLLQQFGTLESDANLGQRSTFEANEPVGSDFMKSSSSLHKLQKEVRYLDHGYGSARAHERHISVSSTNSTCSDQTSSSVPAALFQGMLHSIWKDGLLHHVFSIDDKEVYEAKLFKAVPIDDKVLDYVYTFHSSKNGRKECGFREHESEPVGKMRVSTSITFCSNNMEVKETQFVLYGLNDHHIGDMQASSHALGKNKRLTRKVASAFRSKPSYTKRSSSKFGGTNAIFEETSWDPSRNVHSSLDSGKCSAENQYGPNLELAAIVVRDHIFYTHEEAEHGGWGLKFLKRSGNNASLETSIPSENCPRNSGECSRSMKILVPASFHGGPSTRTGASSSLIDRWISGGCCDCGGWDLGCPLTVLSTRFSDAEASVQADVSVECKSYDLFIQGSKQNIPIMKMVNIHDDLHYIHFQSTLSALQSFAIAAAIIHSHSPILTSEVYRS